jgi:hypothetical protein
VTDSKLGWSLNDDCVLPLLGWKPVVFSMYSYVSEDKSDKKSLTYLK